MSGRQMLTYHVIVPVLVFAALLASGAPLGTALAVGMMTGCVSIVVMMLGSAGEGERTSDATDAHAGRSLVRRHGCCCGRAPAIRRAAG